MRINEISYLSSDEIETIKKDCEFYFGQSDGKLMYRGVPRGRVIGYIKMNFIARRNSLDSPTFLHNELNKYFVNEFGIPFRSGIFATGSINQAAIYGPAMIVMPIGRFQWLCYDQIHDLYDKWKELTYNDPEPKPEIVIRTTDELLNNVLPSAHYFYNIGLKECIRSNTEIMLWCDQYYLIDPKYWSGIKL